MLLTRLVVIACTALSAFALVALLPRLSAPVAAQVATAERYATAGVGNAPQAAQQAATPIPDYLATAAVAQAAAEYAMAQTATAQWAAQATLTMQAEETRAQVTLQWAQVAAQQTQSALTTTAQAVQAAQATGTFSAGAATQTATAAGPAMTATRAAQVVAEEREERGAWAWLIVGLVSFVSVVGAFARAGVGYIDSRGAKERAEAYKISAQVVPPVIAQQPPAPGLPGYVIMLINNELVREDIPALIAEAQAAYSQPAPTIANVTPRPHMTPAQEALIAFVRDAQRATDDWSAAYIPSDAAMGCAGSRWAAHVGTLKALKIAEGNGTGKPAAGKHRTKLTGDWDLGRLLVALQNGQVIVQAHPPAPEE